jgi:hypothetical protein
VGLARPAAMTGSCSSDRGRSGVRSSLPPRNAASPAAVSNTRHVGKADKLAGGWIGDTGLRMRFIGEPAMTSDSWRAPSRGKHTVSRALEVGWGGFATDVFLTHGVYSIGLGVPAQAQMGATSEMFPHPPAAPFSGLQLSCASEAAADRFGRQRFTRPVKSTPLQCCGSTEQVGARLNPIVRQRASGERPLVKGPLPGGWSN